MFQPGLVRSHMLCAVNLAVLDEFHCLRMNQLVPVAARLSLAQILYQKIDKLLGVLRRSFK